MTVSSKRTTFRGGELTLRVVKDRVYFQTDSDQQVPTVIYLSREELLAALSLLNEVEVSQVAPLNTPKTP